MLEALRFPLGENGLFWISTIVTLSATFPRRNWVRAQSLDVIAILILYPLSTIVWGHQFQTFLALLVVAGYLAARCACMAFGRSTRFEPPNLPRRVLIGALLLVALAHVQAVFTRGPDDSGIWSVFGGQYVREHGRLPYGQIGEGGTYGPLMYAISAPVTYLFPPMAPKDDGGRVVVDRHNFKMIGYENCDFLPAKIVMLGFDLALLVGLALIGRQLHSLDLGLVLALVYAVNGLTIARDLLFISHVAPAAGVVLAISCRRYPIASGLLLGCGASILFWPAFLIPLWLSYFATRGRREVFKVSLGIGAVGLASLLAVWMYSEPVGDRGPVAVFVESTWGHQEGGGPYSHSPFGLWGQWIARHPDKAELIGVVKAGVRWSYLALCLLPMGLLVRHRPISATTLIAFSAVLAIGLQFWKTHGGGLYTGWYLPLVIAAFFAPPEP